MLGLKLTHVGKRDPTKKYLGYFQNAVVQYILRIMNTIRDLLGLVTVKCHSILPICSVINLRAMRQVAVKKC